MTTIVLLVLCVLLVLQAVFLYAKLNRARDERDAWKDEADQAEREIDSLKRTAEDTEHVNQLTNRMHLEAIETHNLMHMLHRTLIDSLEENLRDSTTFLGIALDSLEQFDKRKANIVLQQFIAHSRARIQGDEDPLVHSEDSVQGLQREVPGNRDDSVQLDGEGSVQASSPVPVHLQVAGQAEVESGRGDSD